MFVLEIPEIFRASSCMCRGEQALAMLLLRLGGCLSYFNMGALFRCDASTCCRIVCALIEQLDQRWSKFIECNVNRLTRMAPLYAHVIEKSGVIYDNCIGFVDGTCKQVCMPIVLEGVFYSEHKHYHAMRFQAIVTPNGLISHLFGPINGSRHDMFMWYESSVEELLDKPIFQRNYLILGIRVTVEGVISVVPIQGYQNS